MSNKIALFFLCLVLTLLCFQNYTPGTFLTGWDNLMPELNIWLNLKRSFLAVWQEYQGLGLVGGMAHATDLIRQLILLPFTLILPLSLIRYLWHFAMLFLGTFGIYFGLRRMGRSGPSPSSRLFPLAGSLFYLLNFGTIQYFWNPLETFSAFWGFFPWLIFSLWNYLSVWNSRDCSLRRDRSLQLKKLILWNILAIPSFYVQTLFIVYLICLFLILFAHFISVARAGNKLVRAGNKLVRAGRDLPLQIYIKIFLIIFLINSFWLLPQIYFLSGNLQNPVNGIGNFMSNDDTFARNQARGNLSDFLLLRGYYYDFPDNSGQLMSPWIAHFSNQYFLIPGYLLAFFVIIGLISLLTKIRHFQHLSLLLLFLLSATTLLSALPPFSYLNQILRQFPLVNQIFRSPWTKFLVPATFSFSLLAAFGLQSLSRLLASLKYSRRVQILPSLFFIGLLFIFSFPAFKGNFISPKMRQSIPAAYFQLQTYFQNQSPSARIMNLPQGSFWGWTNYRWGYTGSGFLWYLLPQPILDRAFDAWNLKNEQYYWQLSTAIQQKDSDLLINILDKYQVEYIIFDQSIYFPDDKIFSKNALSTQQLLETTPGLSLANQFDHISVYRYQNPTAPFVITSPVTIKPFSFAYHDPAFDQFGDYLNNQNSQYSFPFTSLFTNRLQSEHNFEVVTLENDLQITANNYTFLIPKNDSINHQINYSTIQSPYQTVISENDSQYYRLQSQGQQHLFVLNFPSASLSRSYLAKIDHRHISGLPLEVSIVSENVQNKYALTILPNNQDWQTSWFVLPARQGDDFDSGINFIFNNKSVNSKETLNDVKSVSLYPFPYFSLLRQNNLPSNIAKPVRTYLDFQNRIFYYKINITQSTDNQHLVLPQSFDRGWLAFYYSDKKIHFLKNHTLTNNWANGWEIPNDSTEQSRLFPSNIYIIFWPQILQFLGLGLLIGTIIWIYFARNGRDHSLTSSDSR